MKTAEITKRELVTLSANGQVYLKSYQKSKLSYAVEKTLAKNKNLVDDYYEKVEDARVMLASEDEKGNILLNKEGGYSFTKKNLIELKAKIKALDKEKVEVKIHVASDMPEDITPEWEREFQLLKADHKEIELIEEEEYLNGI